MSAPKAATAASNVYTTLLVLVPDELGSHDLRAVGYVLNHEAPVGVRQRSHLKIGNRNLNAGKRLSRTGDDCPRHVGLCRHREAQRPQQQCDQGGHE